MHRRSTGTTPRAPSPSTSNGTLRRRWHDDGADHRGARSDRHMPVSRARNKIKEGRGESPLPSSGTPGRQERQRDRYGAATLGSRRPAALPIGQVPASQGRYGARCPDCAPAIGPGTPVVCWGCV